MLSERSDQQEAQATSTRRVDAAAMIAMALESARAGEDPAAETGPPPSPPPAGPTPTTAVEPEPSAPAPRVAPPRAPSLAFEPEPPPPEASTPVPSAVGPSPETEEGEFGFSAEPSHAPDGDDLADFFSQEDPSDLFDQLDAVSSGGPVGALAPRSNPLEAALRGPSVDLPSFAPGSDPLAEALRDPSVDLPDATPLDGFLDAGDGPSTDLALAEALEADFLPERAPPPRAQPDSGSDDLIEDESWARAPLAKLELLRAGNEDATRIAGRTWTPTPGDGGPRRRRAWVPTVVGLLLGAGVATTFVPGWAPAPLDGVAPAVAHVLYPEARPRLNEGLSEVVSERVRAFPYTVGDRTVVVVRGEARNTGTEPFSGVEATVLLMDDETEVGRASAPLGDVPSPGELARRMTARARRPVASPPPAPALEAGARAPFLVVIPEPPPTVADLEFRVEYVRGPPRDAAPERR